MRIISAPARAECELDHRFMPSAEYSHCVDEAGGPEEQAVARGLTKQPRCSLMLGSGGSERKAPAAGRVSLPRRLRSGANTAPHQPRGPPGAGVRRELAVRPPWRLPCTARRALSKRGRREAPFS